VCCIKNLLFTKFQKESEVAKWDFMDPFYDEFCDIEDNWALYQKESYRNILLFGLQKNQAALWCENPFKLSLKVHNFFFVKYLFKYLYRN